MYSFREVLDGIKRVCGTKREKFNDMSTNPANNIFEHDWEVFVIKYDKRAGKFVGKTVFCALAQV